VECEGGKREGDRDEYDQSILYACLKWNNLKILKMREKGDKKVIEEVKTVINVCYIHVWKYHKETSVQLAYANKISKYIFYK
jgi:hypothetical protein